MNQNILIHLDRQLQLLAKKNTSLNELTNIFSQLVSANYAMTKE